MPSLSVKDVTISEGPANERTRIDFKVTLSGAAEQPVTVDFATADGTARLAEGDYEATSGTLNFTPGDTERTVTVIFNGDFEIEGDEFLFLNLSNAVGADLLDGQARALVLNDDAAIPNISIGDIEVVEGTSDLRTPATFEITLSGPSTQNVTIDFVTDFASAISSDDAAAAAAVAASVGATSSVRQISNQQPAQLRFRPARRPLSFRLSCWATLKSRPTNSSSSTCQMPTGGVLVDDQGQAAILNDDLDVQTLSVSDVTQLEGREKRSNVVPIHGFAVWSVQRASHGRRRNCRWHGNGGKWRLRLSRRNADICTGRDVERSRSSRSTATSLTKRMNNSS